MIHPSNPALVVLSPPRAKMPRRPWIGIAVGAGELNEQLSDQLDETQRQLRETSAQAVRLETENSRLRARLMTVDINASDDGT